MAKTVVDRKETEKLKIQEKVKSLKDKSINQSWEHLCEFTKTFNENFYIVNAGLLKAGKSALFNALLGKEEFFKTGDIRTTISNQTVTKDDTIFIDTPGIEGNDEDTKEAFKAYIMADILLFTHNISEGELQRSEVEFLHSLKALFPDAADFWKRIVFVGTNKDRLDSEKIPSISEKIEVQIERELGKKPINIFCVESTTFIRGINEDKFPLVKISGINEVLSYIDSIKQFLKEQKRELFLKKIAKEKVQLITLLKQQIGKISKTIEHHKSKNVILLTESKKVNSVIELLLKLESKVVKDLEKKKNDGLPYYSLPSTYLSGNTMSGYDYKSESAAEREASRRFRENFYNKAFRKLDNVANELRILEKSLEKFASDNIYGQVHNEVVLALVNATEEITNGLKDVEGFTIPTINLMISAKIDLSQKYNRDYLDGFFEYDSADWYEKANIDTRSTERYQTGLFGREKWVDYYCYDFYDAVRDLNETLQSNVRRAIDDLRWIYGDVYNDYINQLKNHLSIEIKHVIKKLEEEVLKKDREAAKIDNAINQGEAEMRGIDTLISEINKWEPEIK